MPGVRRRTAYGRVFAKAYIDPSKRPSQLSTGCRRSVAGCDGGTVALGNLEINLKRPGGYGFGGIAVALMGRNHPVGILIAAFLFGILYQGGAELDFELQNVSRDIVVVMQGLVILFCGGLEYLYRPILIRFLAPIEGTE